MRDWVAYAFRFLLSLAMVAPLAVAQESGPEQISIDSGKLKGSTADGVIAFKGVPYASPPGPARFVGVHRKLQRNGAECAQRSTMAAIACSCRFQAPPRRWARHRLRIACI